MKPLTLIQIIALSLLAVAGVQAASAEKLADEAHSPVQIETSL